MKFFCVAGSRGERAKLTPLIACLAPGHATVCAYVSRRGCLPTWDAAGPPEGGLALEVSGADPVARIGAILTWLEPLLQDQAPDIVLTCGASDAALAAALAASLAQIAVAHLDAGIHLDCAPPGAPLLDQAAGFLLAPHLAAAERLARLGMEDVTFLCGDTLADGAAIPNQAPEAASRRGCVCYLGGAALESPALADLLEGLQRLGTPVLLPAAEHARERLAQAQVEKRERLRVIAPLDYLPMQQAIASAALVVTDSPTVQRECYFRATVALGLTPADFPEAEAAGWVRRVTMDAQSIVAAALAPAPLHPPQVAAHRGAAQRAAQFLTGL